MGASINAEYGNVTTALQQQGAATKSQTSKSSNAQTLAYSALRSAMTLPANGVVISSHEIASPLKAAGFTDAQITELLGAFPSRSANTISFREASDTKFTARLKENFHLSPDKRTVITRTRYIPATDLTQEEAKNRSLMHRIEIHRDGSPRASLQDHVTWARHTFVRPDGPIVPALINNGMRPQDAAKIMSAFGPHDGNRIKLEEANNKGFVASLIRALASGNDFQGAIMVARYRGKATVAELKDPLFLKDLKVAAYTPYKDVPVFYARALQLARALGSHPAPILALGNTDVFNALRKASVDLVKAMQAQGLSPVTIVKVMLAFPGTDRNDVSLAEAKDAQFMSKLRSKLNSWGAAGAIIYARYKGTTDVTDTELGNSDFRAKLAQHRRTVPNSTLQENVTAARSKPN